MDEVSIENIFASNNIMLMPKAVTIRRFLFISSAPRTHSPARSELQRRKASENVHSARCRNVYTHRKHKDIIFGFALE